jgi:hypothetical protein
MTSNLSSFALWNYFLCKSKNSLLLTFRTSIVWFVSQGFMCWKFGQSLRTLRDKQKWLALLGIRKFPPALPPWAGTLVYFAAFELQQKHWLFLNLNPTGVWSLACQLQLWDLSASIMMWDNSSLSIYLSSIYLSSTYLLSSVSLCELNYHRF